MQEDISRKDKIKFVGRWFYHRGVVFSAVMLVLSLVSDLGTQLFTKLGMNKAEVPVGRAVASQKQPYESPAFHIFSSVIHDAKAMGVNATSDADIP